jgi:hypothetical protein
LRWPCPWNAHTPLLMARGAEDPARSRSREIGCDMPRYQQAVRSECARRRRGPANAPPGGVGAAIVTCLSVRRIRQCNRGFRNNKDVRWAEDTNYLRPGGVDKSCETHSSCADNENQLFESQQRTSSSYTSLSQGGRV